MRNRLRNAVSIGGLVSVASFASISLANALVVAPPDVPDYIVAGSTSLSTESPPSQDSSITNPQAPLPAGLLNESSSAFGSSSSGVSITGGFSPTVSATGTSTGGTLPNAFATGSLSYYFEITPLVGNAPSTVGGIATGGVSVLLSSGSGGILPGGTLETGSASVDAFCISNCGAGSSTLIPTTSVSDRSDIQGDGSYSQGYSTVYELAVGAIYEVDMSATGSGGSLFGNQSLGTATADPMFSLSSDAADFNFVYSANLLNTTTPLPATLPLFAGGLGLMGLLSKRRKRKNSATLTAA